MLYTNIDFFMPSKIYIYQKCDTNQTLIIDQYVKMKESLYP
jgi:hypothetical protein